MVKQDNALRKFSMIIRKHDFEEATSILNYVLDNWKYDNYAYILHDKDFTEEGTLLEKHYHIVITFIKPVRKSTLLNDLNKKGFNTDGIQLESAHNFYSLLKYLIHLGFDNKTQYEISEVKTFNLNYEELINLDNVEYQEMTKEALWSIIQDSESYGEIYSKMMLNDFRKNIQVIKLLFEEKKANNNKATYDLPFMNNQAVSGIEYDTMLESKDLEIERKEATIVKQQNAIEYLKKDLADLRHKQSVNIEHKFNK